VDIRIKRVYDDPAPGDAYRVLIDRLWSRGLGHERARVDEWLRDLAPSDGLRRWYGHRTERFGEFRRRYLRELRGRRTELSELRRRARRGTVTLLFSARDADRSNAAVLAEAVRRGIPRRL